MTADGPIPRNVEVTEDGITWHLPSDQWTDRDLIHALKQLEALIPHLYDAYAELAAERDKRHPVYRAMLAAVRDIQEPPCSSST